MASPLLMPPWIPPERFVSVRMRPSSVRKRSLCSDPRIMTESKPRPNSTPRVAGSDIIALAKSAVSLSKTGSPSPGGAFLTCARIRPPTLSPDIRALSIQATICSVISWSGHRTILDSIFSKVTFAGSMCVRRSWICSTHAKVSIPPSCCSNFRAMPPAATRPIVSRALARPPPCQFRKPYFWS